MWFSVTCSQADWQRSYKRTYRVHNHDAEAQFVVDAKDDAVNELRASRQAKFANVTTGDIGTTSLRVKMDNDPGTSYKQI